MHQCDGRGDAECVLHRGVDARDKKNTMDETKKYKMPQPWAQTAMLCCVNALPTQVIIMLIIPVLTKGRRVGGQHGRARKP